MRCFFIVLVSTLFGLNTYTSRANHFNEDICAAVRSELKSQFDSVSNSEDYVVLSSLNDTAIENFVTGLMCFYNDAEKEQNAESVASDLSHMDDATSGMCLMEVDEVISSTMSVLVEKNTFNNLELAEIQMKMHEFLLDVLEIRNGGIFTFDKGLIIILVLVFLGLCLFLLFRFKKSQNKKSTIMESSSNNSQLSHILSADQTKETNDSNNDEHSLKETVADAGVLQGDVLEQPVSEEIVLYENPLQPQETDEIVQEESPVKPETVVDESKIRVAFSHDTDKITVLGASVIGRTHIQLNLPCQDFCGYEQLGDGWGIAIASDGAGSAKHSDIGSQIAVKRGIFHFKNRIVSKGWMEATDLPTDAEWMQLAYNAFKAVRDDMEAVANKNQAELAAFAATAIVIVHSPKGLLVSHVGDGRAGYCDAEGAWKSVIVPHKGDEANQTIFLTSEFWNIPNFVMSGVFVPESKVIRGEVRAFALMSDGCENACWSCSRFNPEVQKYEDPNVPFEGFFNPICTTIRQMKDTGIDVNEKKNSWADCLISNGPFAKESDDKTMIVGLFL